MSFFEVSFELAAILIAVAFAAGFVDAIAGGGGLITVPALLLAGANPIEALSTNKAQSTFGSGSAALAYARAGHVNLAEQGGMALAAGIGSMLGACVALVVPTELLKWILPALLIAVALFFATKRGLDDTDRAARMGAGLFGFTVVPLLGAYDGFLGPGTGSFFMVAFVVLAGFGILKATAHTKLLNFASNLGGLVVFAVAGEVWWAVGIAMGTAQFLGARLGAASAIKVGARLIKPLLVVVSLALAVRLIWDLI